METFYDVVIYFFLFGFFGWVCESIFCSVNEKKIVNRGFLNGPICPIYGFGGLIVVYLLAPLQGNLPLLFLMGAVSCTVLEYATSVIMEKMFQAKWWDYSDLWGNINGRVCVKFSLIFGVLSVVCVRLLYPPFVWLMAWARPAAKPWLAWGLILIFSADCAYTVYGILSLNGKLQELKAVSQELRAKLEALQGGSKTLLERLEQLKADTSERATTLRKSVQELTDRWESQRTAMAKRYQHKRLINAFPNMKSVNYQEQFAEMKAALIALREKSRKK